MAHAVKALLEEEIVQSASLRERNKQKRRAAILRAAHGLFIELGYSKTRMEAIASRAEVGIATVYKYFSTKSDLMAELVRLDVEAMLRGVDAVLSNPPEHLFDAVMALLAAASDVQLSKHSNVVRDLIEIGWNKSNRSLYERAQWARAELLSRIIALLSDFQKRGDCSASVDVRAMAEIIYSLFDYNYIQYSRGQIKTVEAMQQQTTEQIRKVVTGCC